jgi:hypothetical protein
MKAHFFDLDSILVTNARVWLVDKTVPNVPIIKISQSDFNLIKSGVYKNQGNNINFSGHTYWLPTDLFEKIKIKSKNHKANIANLGFSMQEFMNKDLIENLEYDINIDNIIHLKNTDDDIYIICSKNTQRNHELMISKIDDKLLENGLKIKKFYHISETFYNRNEDDISHKKVRLLLQHCIGYKTDNDKFTNEELKQYSEVYFYDDDDKAVKLAQDCNKILMFLISNTESSIKDIIKQEIKSNQHILYVNKITSNKVNKFLITKVLIEFSNLIKVFETFKWR